MSFSTQQDKLLTVVLCSLACSLKVKKKTEVAFCVSLCKVMKKDSFPLLQIPSRYKTVQLLLGNVLQKETVHTAIAMMAKKP